MSDSMRRYSDREVAMILRTAAQMEIDPAQHAAVAEAPLGRTQAEIEAIAEAAGIEPGAIRAAIAARDRRVEGRLSGAVGGPTVFRLERYVQGEIPERELTDMVESARWLLGTGAGDTTRQPDLVRWVHATPEGPATELEVARRQGQTRMRILANYENSAGWSLIAGGFAALGGAGLSIALLETSPLVTAGLVSGCIAAGTLGVRVFWRRTVRATTRRLEELMDRLEAHGRRAIEQQSESAREP